jgi:hypothetical protein
MRRSLLRKILPLPFIDDWRFHADDCLVFGSSLAGGRKKFLAQPLVRYRVHGKNHHLHRKKDPFGIYRRRLAINRLFEHFEREQCFNTARLADIGHREFLTVEKPTIRQLMLYASISLGARRSIIRRIGCVAEMMWHFFGTMRLRAADAPNGLSRAEDPPSIISTRLPQHQGTLGARGATRAAGQEHRVA